MAFDRKREGLEMAALKRKMCIHSATPLPFCPAKSGNRAEKLDKKMMEEYGMTTEVYFHRDSKHHCMECQCGLVAGSQTGHYGYGLCRWHERKLGTDEKKLEVADKHLHAIRERNPFAYKDIDLWVAEDKLSARRAKAQVDLTHELKTVRKIVQTIVDQCSGDEVARVNLVGLLWEVKGMLEQGGKIPDEDPILMRLNEIEQKLLTGSDLTETCNGVKVGMSDATRFRLINTFMGNIAKLGLSQWTINKSDAIAYQSFKAWCSDLFQIVRRYIVDEQDMALFCRDARSLGEPKRIEEL